MTPSTPSTSTSTITGFGALYRVVYRAAAYLGLMSVFGSLLYGYRYDAGASWNNLWFNLALYGVFIVPHLVLTRSWYKQAVWGSPAGSPRERRFYILTTIVFWFAVLALHRPIPGPSLVGQVPEVVRFFGVVVFLLCVLLFFQGISFQMIDGLLGVPGSPGSYSHGAETPLFTDGPYAQVRHPMYRAALFAGLCSLLIHPTAGHLLWVLLIGGSFIAFIPVEEAQLIRARGEDYIKYRERTPYRLIRGIW